MNAHQNRNWLQTSIDDIINQCESVSLSSSETDNITVDSGIFFDNKSDCKNISSCYNIGSTYHESSSDTAPPPPPYNSNHNIISSNLESVEISSSFQATNAVKHIPYRDDSQRYTSSVTRTSGDQVNLSDTSRAVVVSPRNRQSLSQRLVNDSNLSILSERLTDRSPQTVANAAPNLPQLPGRSRTNCNLFNVDTHLVKDNGVGPHSSVSHYTNSDILIRKYRTCDSSVDNKSLGICNKCQCSVTDSESACIALGKLYHSACFVCCYCNRSLRGKVFYKDQENTYCENDYMVFGFHKSAKICTACGHIITESILEALGKDFHPRCFKCNVCEKCLDGIPFTVDHSNNIYCITDYHLKFAPRCSICCQSIIPCNDSDDVVRVVVNDRDFHVECYRCQNCCRPLTNDSNCFVWTTDRLSANVKLLCRKCYGDKFRELSSLQ